MKPLTLLMHIDDDEDDRFLFRQSLSEVSLDVLLIEVSSAKEALKMMQQVLPDLVVVDYNMPGMDGLEFIRTVRKNPRFNSTKVILLSTSAEAGKISLENGADKSYVKPTSQEKFHLIIKELLALCA